MKINEMVSLFKLMEDKVDSLYYIDTEIEEFLNAAQDIFVESNIFNSSREKGEIDESFIEIREQMAILLEPITVRDLEFTTTPITTAAINIAIDNSTDPVGTGNEMLYILKVSAEAVLDEGLIKAKYVRHNDFDAFQENSFKKASEDRLQYTYASTGIKLFPDVSYNNISLVVIKKPVKMSIASSIDCEIGKGAHIRIVSLALALAKIPSGAEELSEMYSIVNI